MTRTLLVIIANAEDMLAVREPLEEDSLDPATRDWMVTDGCDHR